MKALVIGYGKSGKAAEKLLKKLGYSVEVHDDGLGLSVKNLDFDLAVKSPGISQEHPLVKRLKKEGVEILGEVELAGRFLKGSVIAVTGTNGKSTTCALLHHALKKLGFKSLLGGNFGTPVSELVERADEETVSVIELSSYQIEDIKSFRAQVGAILNVTPDHLNRYASFKDYARAKLRLLDLVSKRVLNADDPILKEFCKGKNSLCFGISGRDAKLVDEKNIVFMGIKRKLADFKLKGYHNALNILAAGLSLVSLGVDAERALDAMRDFSGLEHRLEFVRSLKGVDFFNDSKSTNVDSLKKAVLSFKRAVFIVGGKDKGLDYSELKEALDRVEKFVAIGETAEKFEKTFGQKVKVCRSLEEAVETAFDIAKQRGCPVVLSPGCSSFDMFKDFVERGKVFKDIVWSLK